MTPASGAWDFAVAGKVIAAVLLGGAIGWQREHESKPAGLRTHILIVLGATLVMEVSRWLALVDGGDSGRIAANIIVGIGFIGAGTIMKEGPTVSGLTSAATIWVDGALGCLIGAGYWSAALLLTGSTIVVLTVMLDIERIAHRQVVRRYRATAGDGERLLGILRARQATGGVLAHNVELHWAGERLTVAFLFASREDRHAQLVGELRPLCESLEIGPA